MRHSIVFEHTEGCEPCSWWTQFWWLLKRSLIAQLRNPTDVTSRLLLSCWIGLLAGHTLIKCAGFYYQ